MRGADPAGCHHVMRTLAAAYLPLVEGLPVAVGCTIPLHACAKAGYWGGGLAAALLQRLSRDGGELLGTANSQSLSNLWWSLSEALKSAEGRQVLSGIDQPRLLEASADCLIGMSDTTPQACSNILLACARLNLYNDRLVKHLTARLIDVSAEATEQALANALYALGELAKDVEHTPQPGLMRRLFELIAARLDEFAAQGLSNMLLGCVNLVYAVRNLRSDSKQLAEELAEECKRRRFASFDAQAFSNSAWALAKMGNADQGWYAAAVEAAEKPGAMEGATPQEWSNLWYALALVRHRPASDRLLKRTAEAAGQLRQGADSQACANMLMALANLRLFNKRLVDALAGRLDELLQQDPAQLVTADYFDSLWALAVMGPDVLSRHSGLVEGLLRGATRQWEAGRRKEWTPERRADLWQAYLEVEALTGSTPRSSALLEAAQAAAVARATKLAEHRPSGKSLEAQVAATLQQLKAEGAIESVQQRVVLEGMGRYVEALVERRDGRRVAVETVIPDDLLASSPRPHEMLGSTELRLRQLGREEGAGEVVRVPYWEWESIKDEAGRKAYLRRMLGVGPA